MSGSGLYNVGSSKGLRGSRSGERDSPAQQYCGDIKEAAVRDLRFGGARSEVSAQRLNFLALR